MLAASLAAAAAESAPPPDGAATVFWTTAERLMPAWRFYPNSSEYGETKPLGKAAAWTPGGNEGLLTWVASFPRQAAWQVWVRRYGGYGQVAVEIDGQPVAGGRGRPGGGRYVWDHLGETVVSPGAHHVDLRVTHCMIDAVLFASAADWSPAANELPEPVTDPVLGDLRAYRDDSALRALAPQRGFVIGSPGPDGEVLYDWLPAADQIAERLCLWGAANQYVTGTLAVRALDAVDELRVFLPGLAGPAGAAVAAENIDLRVVHVRSRHTDLFARGAKRLVPELLLRDDRTELPPRGQQGGFGGGACVAKIPAHQSRQFWLTVRFLPGTAAGTYRGQLRFEVPGSPERQASVAVEIELLPIDLRPAEGYHSIYYPSQPNDPKKPNYVPPERYLAELQDQVRHGLNAVTLYGGFANLPLAQQAGMFQAPCLMHWPGGDAPQQVAEARRLGFQDLYYYGVDEPNTPEQIERCRKEAQRRSAAGLHMMTAINGRAAQEATKDWIDRPVYNIYVFGGPDNEAARYALDKGFRPVSYWTTATTWPLWFRSLAGLYNRRCGYLGSAPWAYQDFPDQRLYDADKGIHRVSYPDEFGQPIPTLCWEAHRAGIDDVRYLEALDRAIATGKDRRGQPSAPAGLPQALEQAVAVRQRCFESISGRWFEYLCRLPAGQLDRTRRELAEATLAIESASVPTP